MDLTYQLTTAPEGMLINVSTGLIEWTPDSQQIGSFEVVILVEDGRGGDDRQTYSIVVENTAPTIESIPVWDIRATDTYRYQVIATDEQNHAVSYELEQAPTGMQIGLLTGEVLWTPLLEDVGVYSVVISATDSFGLSDRQEFELTVYSQSNRAPQITTTPIRSVNEGSSYSYDVDAVDLDGDALSFSLESSPEGMSISLMTGEILWQPIAPSQLGQHFVGVKVQDTHGAYAIQNYHVSVIGRENNAPEIVSTAITTAVQGELYTYDVDATDADGDSLSYRLLDGPNELQINPDTGLISGIPVLSGSFTVSLDVTDQREFDQQIYTLIISTPEVNRAPTIVSSPETWVNEGSVYHYALIANDPDGDELLHTAEIKPSGLTLNSVNGESAWYPENKYVQSIESIDRQCSKPSPDSSNFEPVIKWEWTGSDILPDYNQVITTPLVGQTNDDNNDGVINGLDVPDVIFTGYGDSNGADAVGYIRVLSGDDGSELLIFDQYPVQGLFKYCHWRYRFRW